MHSQRKLLVYSAVQNSTEQGHESLKKGEINEASKHFSNALEKAELYREEFLIRACSFNLGSCLVACGRPSKGLEYLEIAVPPEGDSDGLQNFADLEYNIGIARHALGNVETAVEAYTKAAEAYKELDDLSMQVETHRKIAICYQALKMLKEAASSFKTVADLYEEMNESENRAIALSSLTTLLAELEEMDECSKTLKSLLELCQEFDNSKLKGKIYHSIGMLYSSEKCYKSAYECFEQSYHALQEVTDEMKDKTLEAVVLLNMGASLNKISLFERAVIFHKMAADEFGELGDLKSQGQVFCNLAFAYSQTENYEDARISFTQAIQCCKNCDDAIGQCLATEGLAAICFREKDYQSAVDNYKEALSLVAKTGVENNSHSDRIINKLAETVEYQLKMDQIDNRQEVKGDAIDSSRWDGRHIGRRRRRGKPKYGKFNSLVAKGLEATDAEEDEASTSFYDSESESSTSSSSSTESNEKVEATIENKEAFPEPRGIANGNGRYHLTASPPLLDHADATAGNGNGKHLEVDEKPQLDEPDRKSSTQRTQSKTCVVQ